MLLTSRTFIPCAFWLCNHGMFYLLIVLSSDILQFCEKIPNRPNAISQVCKYNRQRRASKPEEVFLRVPISNEQLTTTNFNLWF